MPSRELSATRALFSEGASIAIQILSQGDRRRGDCSFPRFQAWDGNLPRIKTRKGEEHDETVPNWFKRVIGQGHDTKTRLKACSIEDSFAFFGRTVWNSDGISFCGLQAIVTEGPLIQFYAEPSPGKMRATYYRLDYDPTKPGPLFKESQPHVHSTFDGPPRFPFSYRAGEFIVTAFIEFIYLNHFHDTWLNWAKREATFRDVGLPFNRIVEAYNSGKLIQNLAELKPHIVRLKSILFDAKRKRVENAPLLPEETAVLNYSV